MAKTYQRHVVSQHGDYLSKFFLCFIIAISLIGGCHLVPGTPEAAFHEFQTTQHKESWIVAPLCAAGEMVVPLVTEKIKDKNLDRRIYGIGFLGTTETKIPMDTLEAIVMDETETEGFRSTALESLFLVDETRGRAVALKFIERSDYLGKAAKEVLAVEVHAEHKKKQSQ